MNTSTRRAGFQPVRSFNFAFNKWQAGSLPHAGSLPYGRMSFAACLMTIVVAIGCQTVLAEAVWTRDPADNSNLTVRMEVTAADEPVPAFKYRLSLRPHELVPGNSVLHYMRAFPEGGIERVWKSLRDEYGLEELDKWSMNETPISQIPLDKARKAAQSFDGTIGYIRLGAQSRDTDWGRGVENMKGPDIIAVLLPEIQASREMSRALSLCTRVAIAEQNYDEAIDLMRMNYRLGQDVEVESFLVCDLVGIAICGIANDDAIDLIAAPDSPNLYWALAERRQPMVSLRDSIRAELALGSRMFGMLDADDSMQLSPGEWNALWVKGITDFAPVMRMETGSSPWPPKTGAELAAMSLGLMGYSHAKQRLIDWGYQADEVEAMAVGQVLSLYSTRAYRMAADAQEKAYYVPLSDARAIEREAEDYLKSNGIGRGPNRELVPVASLLLPAMTAARSSSVRLEREMAALQVIEALRMHAARNGNQWPQRLDDVTCVPVPVNPATGQPFMYELEGGTAILTLPKSDGVHVKRRFELTIAK